MYVQEIPNKAIQINEARHHRDYWLSEDNAQMPTFNDYRGRDGGYVAIYTHNPQRAIYAVSSDIYVMGTIRVQGNYIGRIFVPTGYQIGNNITQDPEILAMCENHFPDMKGEMWVGGDTGGWFGLYNNVNRPDREFVPFGGYWPESSDSTSW